MIFDNNISHDDLSKRLERMLPRVTKPGRYTGGELNSVLKDWNSVSVHLALAFPDLYDLGMSNLGLTVLYDLVNQHNDMLAERVFSPWVDMEDVMRKEGLPLFALESRRPIVDFDVLGISLPYEQLYTNAINLLDLSGIPILSLDRSIEHPVVIAGGHATFNPEPMASFIDAFIIGDGEEVLVEVMEAVATWKHEKLQVSRSNLLERLATISGVYVPSLYAVNYDRDGKFIETRPKTSAVPEKIVKRIVPVLPPPPVKPVIPFIQTTHDRGTVEIMRGCTRGCRFCHAGFVMRPVRERNVDEVVNAISELVNGCGYEEVGLLSLSSSDYTNILPLIDAIEARFGENTPYISLPSLRIESTSTDLMESVSHGRKGSATFAPEAATDRIRHIINKPISEQDLLQVTEDVFARGWRTVKLYFMIGHPQEKIDDVKGIADMAWSVLRQGRKYHGRRARVNLGISTFIPKAHTPFQWASIDSSTSIKEKQALLKEQTRTRGLDLKWNEPDETLLEGMLSRGDRRLGKVIYRAWQMGAKFDGWREHFDFGRWLEALDANDLSLSSYTRARDISENLPWDHIDPGVNKAYLVSEYQHSLRGEIQPDCREGCVACGILSVFNKEYRTTPPGSWQCP